VAKKQSSHRTHRAGTISIKNNFIDYGHKDGYNGLKIPYQGGGNNAKAIFHS
jgi:hypothetical protein